MGDELQAAGEGGGVFQPEGSLSIRDELCMYAARLKQRGLTSATGGNISCRVGDDMWISPTGCELDELHVDDWVKVSLASGEPHSHRFAPSSELPMHRAIFQTRTDVSSIMHSHPPHVIALSLVGIELKPIGSEAPLVLGERIPIVPYEIPASPMLAEAAAGYAKTFNALVLENHGLVTLGRTNREAYNRTELAEEIAHIMTIAYSLGKGEPRLPSAEEIEAYKTWYFEQRLSG